MALGRPKQIGRPRQTYIRLSVAQDEALNSEMRYTGISKSSLMYSYVKPTLDALVKKYENKRLS